MIGQRGWTVLVFNYLSINIIFIQKTNYLLLSIQSTKRIGTTKIFFFNSVPGGVVVLGLFSRRQ